MAPHESGFLHLFRGMGGIRVEACRICLEITELFYPMVPKVACATMRQSSVDSWRIMEPRALPAMNIACWFLLVCVLSSNEYP